MNKIKKIGKFLCSMKFGIILLIIMILLCVAGSVIPQGEIEAYYTGYYPEKVGWLILLTGVDDVFHSWYFAGISILLCLNLLGCNLIHFPGLYKGMKENYKAETRFKKLNDQADIIFAGDIDKLFSDMGFSQKEKLEESGFIYAIRRKLGIWGAWLTHLGMLIIIAGFSLGQIFTVKYTVYGVVGQTLPVEGTPYSVSINDFNVELRADETVEQYTSNLTVTDTSSGKEITGDTSVNHPLSAHGMSVYQNSTGWAATVLVFKGEELVQEEILCAGEHLAIKDYEDLVLAFNAFYPDYVKDEGGSPSTASSQLNNPAYLYTVYFQGNILGMNVLQDDYITIDDYTIAFKDPQQYTLIQLKRDPFTKIPLVGSIVILAALFISFYYRTEEMWAVENADGSHGVSVYSKKGNLLLHDKLKDTIKAGERK